MEHQRVLGRPRGDRRGTSGAGPGVRRSRSLESRSSSKRGTTRNVPPAGVRGPARSTAGRAGRTRTAWSAPYRAALLVVDVRRVVRVARPPDGVVVIDGAIRPPKAMSVSTYRFGKNCSLPGRPSCCRPGCPLRPAEALRRRSGSRARLLAVGCERRAIYRKREVIVDLVVDLHVR